MFRPLAAPLRITILLALAPALLAQTAASIRHVDRTTLDGQVFHATTYDVARERVVLFGSGQTWEWNGNDWVRRHPTRSPRVTAKHSLAYDTARQQTVYFGGGETWLWDGFDWQQMLPVHSPSAREAASMSYDAVRERVVLFGGSDGQLIPRQLRDTWEWDGNDWQQRSPAHSPPPRQFGAMAYDATRQETVLYSGYDGIGRYGTLAPRADAWTWDGTNWTAMSTGNLPSYLGFTLAFDAARGRTVLFGSGGSSTAQVETWEWDGVTWHATAPASTPARRFHPAAAYDAARGEVLLCGGTHNDQLDGIGECWNQAAPLRPVETWAWDGTAWSRSHLGDSRPDRQIFDPQAPLVFDSNRGTLVTLTSHNVSCNRLFAATTREWDGRSWQPRGEGPVRLHGDAMAFDSTRGVAVLFGGTGVTHAVGWIPEFDETWEWDGASWLQRSPLTTPPARADHGLVFDEQRDVCVLFGGAWGYQEGPISLGDTWEYDGTDWTHRTPATTPPARHNHAMAHDPVRNVTIVHGGYQTQLNGQGNLLSDTWEWDGTDWRQVATSGPPAAQNHAMCWDPSRQEIVMYVGRELWAHNGRGWYLLWHEPLPEANGAAMAYDPSRQALVVVGNGITRLIGDVARAHSVPVARGCPGAAGVPRLHCEPPRFAAGEVRLELDRVAASTALVFALSPTQQTVALGSGCSFYLGSPTVALAGRSNAQGFADLSIDLPFLLSLRGADFYAQAVALDPQAALPGTAFSQGLQLRIGD